MSRCAVLLFAIFAVGSLALSAAEPVNSDLIPEGRRILDYFESIYGKKTICGQATGAGLDLDFTNARVVHEVTGEYPAIISLDLSGWNRPTWGDSYRMNLQRTVDGAKKWYKERGGLVSMQWHWNNPMREDGSAWINPPRGTGRVDIKRMVTPGTDEHKAAMADLEKSAEYLEQLREARVPVLFRPLHEIDGGWFWWTDRETPENTAALWRMIFDYYVKERKLDNLIWVYSAGVRRQPVELRQRFYPGAEYVDIAGIDIYSDQAKLDYRKAAYREYFDAMAQVAPGKMLALSECDTIPNPDVMAKEGPRWLYCLPWWAPGKNHPADWAKFTHNHDFVLTLDEIPDLRKE